MPTTHYRACHLCEAICGLKIVTENEQIISITGDMDDPLSKGHICPKGVALKDLHNDPDRLKQPLHKVNGQWHSIEWDEAYQLVADKLHGIASQYGNDAVSFYAGNPNVHNYGHMTHGAHFSRLLRTKNRFSATSVDQLPHHVVSLWMYGHQSLLPIADIDHTDFLLVLGANPMASNGSLLTAPDIRNRLKAIRKRGGQLVVIDPRRTETAKLADTHHFIRPGTDAALLLALINLLFANQQITLNHLGAISDGLADVEQAVQPFTAQWAAHYCGIAATEIEALALQLASAPSAAVYGRMGVSTQGFGTLCQWAIQVLNLITGNLDSVGGTLVTSPAVNPAGPTDRAKGQFGQWHSRVRGLPEFAKELPCSAMIEEIETAGEGQIKAMVTIAGNPVLSTPTGQRLDKALAGLEFMVSIDPYLNETTRHADIILPPASPLAHSHYDIVFARFAVHNTAKFSPEVFAKAGDERYDYQILNGLALALSTKQGKPVAPLPKPELLLAHMLSVGPYSQGRGDVPAISLELLKANPSGIDLGPLRPSLSKRLCTDDQRIHTFNDIIAADINRLAQAMDKPIDGQLSLIGKRDLRSNNSWMHNLPYLIKGKPRCVLLMHPDDMAAKQLQDGQAVTVSNAIGSITLTVSESHEMMPSVVCMPHGWGHTFADTQQQVANDNPGVNMNQLTDVNGLDPVCGNAILSGISVTVSAA
ncbi:molybdopterin-dependent oxidoreductase [Ferrimonas lipolytica]|uniref:Molybdopterin-dependent oxidoreductase n=1 Tax=Ferrimonas lipolytica TaxID=2724191 RepID=A0A6H1UAN4_9GAMM|nr:molybdopterin-dependent oxidoreductase [Ferrimonas lipolytica]QIZ75650.1 molybdopterin-dependent oxidoreductase [Ferrimonas lipolytica]